MRTFPSIRRRDRGGRRRREWWCDTPQTQRTLPMLTAASGSLAVRRSASRTISAFASPCADRLRCCQSHPPQPATRFVHGGSSRCGDGSSTPVATPRDQSDLLLGDLHLDEFAWQTAANEYHSAIHVSRQRLTSGDEPFRSDLHRRHPDRSYGVANAALTGHPELARNVPAALSARGCRDERHRGMVLGP